MAVHRVLLLFMASAICAAMSERAADFSIKDAPRRSSSVQQRTNPFAKDARTKQQQQPTYQPVFVEVLQQRYLLLEDAMWSVIVSGLEQSYVLQQIHNGYQTFFLGNITVYNAYLSTFDPHQSVIYEAMNAINQSAAETVHRYLQASSHAFSERDALAISVRNQNLTYQLDTLFDKMANTDFLTIVRNKAELKQCDNNVFLIKSANQQIFEYYHDISVAQLKAYALVQLSYMFFTVYGRGNFRSVSQSLRTKFLDRTHESQALVKQLLANSKRDIWRCDPLHFSIGTFEEVTNLLQGYVDNEENLNAEETCRNTCGDYKATQNYGCADGTYCGQKAAGAERDRARCNGKVVDCQFLGSDMNVCSNPNDATRRYDVIHYDNGNVLGRNGDEKYGRCESTSDRIQSWTRWVVRCSNCFCLCDDPKDSHRHFSLRDVVSNIYRNRVVSAVALKKLQKVFHLIVVERELQPYAHLNTTTPTWHSYSALTYFDVHDGGVREGIDYYTLSWQNRTLNLDTVEVPAGKVVTGVRFRAHGASIGLEVRGTDFDLTTGQLKNIEDSRWYRPAPNITHEEIPLDNLDVPILTPEKSIPNPLPGRFVRFGPTDKFKDLAQTTIPFIDAQLVEPNNPTALSGVGLYYKTFAGYGGFVAPKLLNYNFEPHIAALTASNKGSSLPKNP